MIAIDWGTSSFRAWRLADDGTVRDQRSAPDGLLAARGRFAAVLAQHLAGWDDPLVLMAGMVGSRNGWHEVPYVAAPAGLAEIAAGIAWLPEIERPDELADRRIGLVPGLSCQPADGAPEVMRGEETQVLGLADTLDGDGPHTVVLPGTHSKWVTVEGHGAAARITGWRTAMTGEVYALLRRHSLLAALMPPLDGAGDPDADDPAAFADGVAASALDGGLLHHLFGVRTRGLLAGLAPAAAPSFLSGLLIGHELRAQALPAGAAVHLVGAPTLVRRYQRALDRLGHGCLPAGEDLGARGLQVLASQLA